MIRYFTNLLTNLNFYHWFSRFIQKFYSDQWNASFNVILSLHLTIVGRPWIYKVYNTIKRIIVRLFRNTSLFALFTTMRCFLLIRFLFVNRAFLYSKETAINPIPCKGILYLCCTAHIHFNCLVKSLHALQTFH